MKVIFIFSEGPHDVGFIKLVLELCCNIKHEGHAKILDFPRPINSVFIQLMKNHTMGDLSLDMVHKFLLPNYVFKTEKHFIMLFNTGGMTNYSYIKRILSQIIQQLKTQDNSFDIKEEDVSYLFTYDADYRTPMERIDEMKQLLFPITENDAYPEDKETLEVSPNTLLNAEDKYNHFYIWAKNESSGTLEDILLPIYSKNNKQLLEKSQDFIDNNFPNKFNFSDAITKDNIATKSKKIKACITIAGQGEKPSRPLTAIIEDNVLADKKSFETDKKVQDFVRFLHTNFSI